MAEQTPPGALPTIRPGMKIAFSLEMLIALAGGLIFCTSAYWKLDVLDRRVERIEKALGVGDQRAPGDSTSSLPQTTGGHP